MSHTPATWHVVRYAVSSYHIVTDGDAGPVASIPTDHPDSMANARLIAAAPELLEACKGLVAFIDAQGPGVAPTAYLDAREAISQAEGKA